MPPSHSHDPFSRHSVKILQGQIESASLPFSLHTTDTIDSTMNIARWANEHLVEANTGTVLITKHQTAGQGASGEWLSNPADLKATILVGAPANSNQHSLARLGYAWATSEAIRIAAAVAGTSQRFETAIKWPNDVRLMSNGRTLKIAGILHLAPRLNEEDRALTKRHGWECPQNLSLLGIGIGLTRPTIDKTVTTHLGPRKLSEIATTLDQYTKRPVMWGDLIIPLLTKVAFVDSLLAEGNLDTLATIVSRRFALGPDNRIVLERRSAPPEEVVFISLNSSHMTIEADAQKLQIPLADIVRFAPAGSEGV